jgi:sugar lactone lactonase YvrE
MTTTNPELEEINPSESGTEDVAEKEERRRRSLLLLLLLLLLLSCCVGYLIVRYMIQPQPLPEMIPGINQVNYPPAYKFSFPADKPVGVAISPDGQRIYVAESAGERLIKIFDPDGVLIKSFSPPFTTKSNRKPNFIAVDAGGRVFVSDTYNMTISIYDADGNYIDGIIGRDATLSKVIAEQNLPQGTIAYYDSLNQRILYQLQLPPGQNQQSFSRPFSTEWAPLGLRFDQKGNLLVTNLVGGKHEVLVFQAEALNGSLVDFNSQVKEFGVEGTDNGQFSFPNSVVTDSRGNYYVSDGNNGRISLWTPDMQYKTFFGFGSADSALNLPRGAWMDSKDRLHVADAIGGSIRVYDVSQDEPAYLFSFGNYGTSEGFFAFPNDICIDNAGRLYIADRENGRIQIWSY